MSEYFIFLVQGLLFARLFRVETGWVSPRMVYNYNVAEVYCVQTINLLESFVSCVLLDNKGNLVGVLCVFVT